MSTQLLVNVLAVGPIAPLGSIVIPHGLKVNGQGVVPRQAYPDRASPLIVSNMDATNIYVINPAATAETANFRVEFDHSIHAVGATPIKWQGVQAATGPAFAATYGAFSDSTDQPLTAGVASTVKFDTVELAGGVTVANDGLGRPTRLTVPVNGTYQFDISPQLQHTGGGKVTITFWLLLDGVAVPRSASSFEMGNNLNRSLPFISILLPMTAGQYVEWAFLSSGTNTSLEHFAAAGAVPAIPSVIANALRVA
jgi:hypothetical protein